MAELKLRSELRLVESVPQERRPVSFGDADRWDDGLFDKEFDLNEVLAWFAELPGLRGQLYYALASLSDDREEILLLKRAADPAVRYVEREMEEYERERVIWLEVQVQNLKERIERLRNA